MHQLSVLSKLREDYKLPDGCVNELLALFHDSRFRPEALPKTAAGLTDAIEQSKVAPAEEPGARGHLLREVSAKCVDYLSASAAIAPKDTTPVVRLMGPVELTAAFDEAGVGIGIGAPCEDESALLRATDLVLRNSVNVSHPMFFNQLFAAPDPAGVAGDWVSSVLNASMYTYEIAPVFSLMERVIFEKLASYVGPTFAENAEGIFCPGGSACNQSAMQLARHHKQPEMRQLGSVQGGSKGRLVAFTSVEGHYSFLKGAILLGLGSDALISVPVDPATHRMNPAALEEAIVAAIARGDLPFFVNATAATTVMGAFDPFDAIADVAQKYGLWMHIDGAWGGSALVSDKTKAAMAGADRADSITWNQHKMMGIPLQCCALMTRHRGIMQACNGTGAKYLFQKDKENASLDTGDMSVQCGRKVDCLKLWLAWKAHGDAGYAARIDHAVAMAGHLTAQIKASDGRFKMVMDDYSFTNVCFWFVPPALRPWDPSKATEDQRAAMHAVAPHVKKRMQETGTSMVGFQPLGDLPNFFRMIVVSPKVTPAHLDEFLAIIERFALEVAA